MRKIIAPVLACAVLAAGPAWATPLPRDTFFAFQEALSEASSLGAIVPFLTSRAVDDLARLPDTEDANRRVLELFKVMGALGNEVVLDEQIRGQEANLVLVGTGKSPVAGRLVKVQTSVLLREEGGSWKIERLDSQALAD